MTWNRKIRPEQTEGLVPYTGATQDVNLGVNNLIATTISATTYQNLPFIPTNTSDLVNDGEDGTSPFVTVDQLPSNLNLFATNVASDIPTYFKLVTSIDDPDYNTIPVDIPTGAITTTGQFIAALSTEAGVLIGNPGIINLLTIGNIRRVSGTGTADFYYEVYQRTSGGTETLVTTSNATPPISVTIYTEFLASALLNNGTFLDTDRIVVKYYGNRIPGSSNPSYEFQFGGVSPVRTTFPVPASNLPFSLDTLSDVNISGATTGQVLSYDGSEWENKTIISGTTGYIPKFNSDNTIEDSVLIQNGGNLETAGDLTLEQLKFNDGESYLGVSNDVRNWYLTGKQFSIATEEGSPSGLFFKPDGTRFYIVGTSNDRVRAYDMLTPWDITTAVIAELFSVSVESGPTDLFFKDDGTVLYIVGSGTDLVRQFTLPTPWILTGAVAAGTFNVSPQDGAPTGLFFSPDGSNMYVAGDTTPDKVLQYVLSTPWDITTSTFLQQFSVTPQETAISALDFNDDGTRMYILGTTGDDITEYRLSTPWDISTAIYFSESFTFTQESAPTGLYYNEHENRAYILGSGFDTIIELGTTKQLKIYGDSVVTDSQMYVGGRFESRGEVYVNGTIRGNSTLIVASNLIALNLSTASSTATLGATIGLSTLNLGGGTVGSNNRFAYGAVTSGLTKNIEIGTNGLGGSNTLTKIGSILSDGLVTFNNNTIFDEKVSITNNLIKMSPTGVIAVLDTFTETSNTLLNLHTPDTGSGWTRVQIGAFTTPTFTVFSATNTMGVTTNVADQGVIYREDTFLANPNYEVRVDLMVQDSADDVMWLFARYQDSDNWYGVKWSISITNCILVKKVGGVFTILSTLPVVPQTGVSSLALRVFNNTILVLNGGVVVMGATDNSIIDAGYSAIGAGNIGQLVTDDFENWRFDNFTVQYYENENSLIALEITGSTRITDDLIVEGNIIKDVKIITGDTYTLLNTDRNKILHFTSNTDVVITIPTGLNPNNRYEGKQLGTGQLLFGTDMGVDLRVGASELAKTAEQYSVFGLDVIGPEEYLLYGKLELV